MTNALILTELSVPAIITVCTWLVLYWLSIVFNRYIDNAPAMRSLPDDQTARWVVIGTAYTLLGHAVVMGVWAAFLPHDWRLSLTALGLALSCFVASGYPMYAGDARRQREKKEHQVAIDTAKKALESCNE